MRYSLIDAIVPWIDQLMSEPNAGSPPTIFLQFMYVISKVEPGFMFWPAIIDDDSIRPFRIENGVKID